VLKAIVANNPHIHEEHLQYGLKSMCCKIASGFKYIPKETFGGETLLIKARSEALMTKSTEIGDDYGLAQICSKINVIEVNGDHEAFVQEDTFAQLTAEHINKFF